MLVSGAEREEIRHGPANCVTTCAVHALQGQGTALLQEPGSQQQSSQAGRMLTSKPVLMLLSQDDHLESTLQVRPGIGHVPA
jgi:hypothetical protein